MNGMSKMDLVLVLNSELTSNKTVCLIKGRPFLGGFFMEFCFMYNVFMI